MDELESRAEICCARLAGFWGKKRRNKLGISIGGPGRTRKQSGHKYVVYKRVKAFICVETPDL